METRDRQLGPAGRLLVAGCGAVLLVVYALCAYVDWTISRKYFHYDGWPRIGWGGVLWLVAASYCLLVGCTGRWRPARR